MTLSTADFLVTLAEPTRLRILNCIAAAPLFVSDLVAILRLPQPTVSRHLRVLREIEVVHDIDLSPYVLYTLAPPPGSRGRLVRAVLDALRADPVTKVERSLAQDRTREGFRARVGEPAAADAS